MIKHTFLLLTAGIFFVVCPITAAVDSPLQDAGETHATEKPRLVTTNTARIQEHNTGTSPTPNSQKFPGDNNGVVAIGIDFDSDRNVGSAPVIATFWGFPIRFRTPKTITGPLWSLGYGFKSSRAKPRRAFWEAVPPEIQILKAWYYAIGYAGPFNRKPNFINVYAPGGYGRLQVVAASPTARENNYTWENAIDGDTYGKDGTAFVMPDETGKPWAIFKFIDQRVRNINKLRMMNDTGIKKSIGRMVREFTVLVSTTGTAPEDFTTLLQAEKTNNVETPWTMYDDWMDWQVPATAAKYIKLVIDAPIDPHYDHLGEFEVWFETILCDAAQSFINAVSPQAASEVYQADITLTLADENGKPVEGKTFHDITLHSLKLGNYNSETPLWLSDRYDNLTEVSPGVYTATLTATGAGERKIVASVNGVVVEKTAANGNEDCIINFDDALGKRIAGKTARDVPEQFGLLPNYPNPFNPVTQIRYTVPRETFISLKIYNIAGHEVAILADGYHGAGSFTRTWNAEGMPSGIYFYRLTADGCRDVRQMILLK